MNFEKKRTGLAVFKGCYTIIPLYYWSGRQIWFRWNLSWETFNICYLYTGRLKWEASDLLGSNDRIPVSGGSVPGQDRVLPRRFPGDTVFRSEQRSPDCAGNLCRTFLSHQARYPSPELRHIPTTVYEYHYFIVYY